MTDHKSYLVPSIIAIALHAVVIALLAGSWFDHRDNKQPPRVQYVKAELVDLKSKQIEEQKKQEALKRKKKQEQLKKQKEQERKQQEKKRKQEAAKKAKAEKDRKVKEAAKKKAEAAEKTKAEKERKAKEAAKKKADAAKKAKADKERKAKETAKKKAEAEKAKKLAAEKKRKEAEAKAAAEKKRQQEQARQQRERELVDALAREEQARQNAELDKKAKASAESIIRQAVSSNWRRPPTARNGMQVSIRIHLIPTGEVVDVVLVKPSSDDAFNRSAVNAVWKAERFPELQQIDPVVFDRNLRTITLTFRPEDLRL